MAVQMTTTTETKDDAIRIARGLVEQKLAACVQIIGPITSVYWWEGKIAEAEEYQCIIKTRADLTKKVITAIETMHPYDVPEVIATPITEGSEAYLTWINDETQD